jgi:hypothetical protein
MRGLNLGFGLSPNVLVVGDDSLQDVIPSNVFDIDATQLGSYGGTGQIWSNITASPADGAPQSDHDYFVGDSGSPEPADPTFTGSAGDQGAYWALDGNDGFRLDAASVAAMPSFYKNLHKSTGGQPHSICFVGRFTATSGGSFALGGTGSFSTSSQGLVYFIPGFSQTDRLGLGWYDGSGANTLIASDIVADATDVFVVMTFDPSSGNYKAYVNGGTVVTGTASAQTTTTDPSAIMEIMQSGFVNIGSGSRLYSCSMFNEVLSDSQVSDLKSFYEARHGRVYS